MEGLGLVAAGALGRPVADDGYVVLFLVGWGCAEVLPLPTITWDLSWLVSC